MVARIDTMKRTFITPSDVGRTPVVLQDVPQLQLAAAAAEALPRTGGGAGLQQLAGRAQAGAGGAAAPGRREPADGGRAPPGTPAALRAQQ